MYNPIADRTVEPDDTIIDEERNLMAEFKNIETIMLKPADYCYIYKERKSNNLFEKSPLIQHWDSNLIGHLQ